MTDLKKTWIITRHHDRHDDMSPCDDFHDVTPEVTAYLGHKDEPLAYRGFTNKEDANLALAFYIFRKHIAEANKSKFGDRLASIRDCLRILNEVRESGRAELCGLEPVDGQGNGYFEDTYIVECVTGKEYPPLPEDKDFWLYGHDDPYLSDNENYPDHLLAEGREKRLEHLTELTS